jgi:hypothetical protein
METKVCVLTSVIYYFKGGVSIVDFRKYLLKRQNFRSKIPTLVISPMYHSHWWLVVLRINERNKV